MPRRRLPAPPASLPLLLLLLLLGGFVAVRSAAAAAARIPECGAAVVTSRMCRFGNVNRGSASLNLGDQPVTSLVDVLSTSTATVPLAGNGLRQVIKRTFRANPAKPASYLNPPLATVVVNSASGTRIGTARLAPSRERSIQANSYRYKVQVQRGSGNAQLGGFPPGPCTMIIRARCGRCPVGQADFGAGCEAATATSAVCPSGEATFEGGPCVAAAECPAGQARFGDAAGCVAAAEASECTPRCSYADATCAAGAVCPGGTLVSAACADRSAFDESPCACTALQQLAALSTTLSSQAPWGALADNAYCQAGSLRVDCATVDDVELPTYVAGAQAGLTGALPPSLGELRSSLTGLDLGDNAISSLPAEIGALTGLTSLNLEQNPISSVPTELGALTGLADLRLNDNQLTGVPAEFRSVDPSTFCGLSGNPDFSCANVGYTTNCCTSDNCGDTSTCYGSTCAYSDTACAAGAVCPGGTLVSAACADRSAFDESPCACTALQQLAALSTTLSSQAPWGALADNAYCQAGSLRVDCATVDDVELPTYVAGAQAGLTGALLPSLGELRSSLTGLDLGDNAISSLPAEIGALTGLTSLALDDNDLTSVPPELAALTSLTDLYLDNNELTGLPAELRNALLFLSSCFLNDNAPDFSCANLGLNSACCARANNCGTTPGGFLPGGPCHGDPLQAECEAPASLFPAGEEFGVATPLGTGQRSGGGGGKAAHQRIINGDDAKFCAPYFSWLGYCGGTMIAPGLVLTAAHCVEDTSTDVNDDVNPGLPGDYLRVGGNRIDRANGHRVTAACCPFGTLTVRVRATGAVIHPSYNRNSFVNDMALIFVEPTNGAASIPADFSACPTRAALSVGDATMALGLGATTNDGNSYPAWLQYAVQEINDPSVCPYSQWNAGTLASYFYCVSGNWHRNPGVPDPGDYRYICSGDSGSGLMKREGGAWEVAGVASFAYGNGGDRRCGLFPSGYAKLNHPEAVSFVKPYLVQYRTAAGLAQCPGWEE